MKLKVRAPVTLNVKDSNHQAITPKDKHPQHHRLAFSLTHNGGSLYTPEHLKQVLITSSPVAHKKGVCGLGPDVKAWLRKVLDGVEPPVSA